MVTGTPGINQITTCESAKAHRRQQRTKILRLSIGLSVTCSLHVCQIVLEIMLGILLSCMDNSWLLKHVSETARAAQGLCSKRAALQCHRRQSRKRYERHHSFARCTRKIKWPVCIGEQAIKQVQRHFRTTRYHVNGGDSYWQHPARYLLSWHLIAKKNLCYKRAHSSVSLCIALGISVPPRLGTQSEADNRICRHGDVNARLLD